MSVTICFDFGNTRKKAAIFYDKKLSQTIVLEDDAITTLQKLLDTHKPEKTILSSVVNHNAEIETLLTERTRFPLLSSKSKLPFTTPIAKPEAIGADRLAMA